MQAIDVNLNDNPRELVNRVRGFVRHRERGGTLGAGISTSLTKQLTPWLAGLKRHEQWQLLSSFMALLDEPSDSEAFDRWLDEYERAVDPPKSWRRTLREEIRWQQRMWSHWVQHEVSPEMRHAFASAGPEQMLRCLEMKGTVKNGVLQIDTKDTPPQITAELVAEVMDKPQPT